MLVAKMRSLRSCVWSVHHYKNLSSVVKRMQNHQKLHPASGTAVRFFHSTSFTGVIRSSEKDFSAMSQDEWKDKLSPEAYNVCRECGTEPPFSGKYYYHKEDGTYTCVCCEAELFSSEHKYESGTGWPSFHTALGTVDGDESKTNIVRRSDNSTGTMRIEVICKKCEAHLGHVFNDGPPPTRLRFCINSVSLNFKPKGANSGDAK